MEEKKKVLLIEDDDFLSKMYATKLEMEGYHPLIALDGERGLKRALKDKPDLVILDILLPKLDGLEVLRRIKADKRTKQIPVILLTNLSQKEDIQTALNLGASDYLIKAYFMPSEVIEKIKKYI